MAMLNNQRVLLVMTRIIPENSLRKTHQYTEKSNRPQKLILSHGWAPSRNRVNRCLKKVAEFYGLWYPNTDFYGIMDVLTRIWTMDDNGVYIYIYTHKGITWYNNG